MTVCIAAICESGKHVVVASDAKVSFFNYSADDLALKSERIAPGWHISFAGDDMDQLQFVLDEARARLREWIRKKRIPPLHDATNALLEAYEDLVQRHIESKFLRRYKLTARSFLDDGKKKLSEILYNRLSDKIATFKLSLAFLLVGFEGEFGARIIEINGEGASRNFSPVGFCAIGSGANAAMSSLAFHAHHNTFGLYGKLQDCIYYVCDAKFTAESASDVGESTFLMILGHGQKPRFIFAPDIDRIRKMWERYGSRRVPSRKIEDLRESAYSLEELFKGGNIDKVFGKSRRTNREIAIWKEWKALMRSKMQGGFQE